MAVMHEGDHRSAVAEREHLTPRISFLRHPGSNTISAKALGRICYEPLYQRVTPQYIEDKLGPLTLYEAVLENPEDGNAGSNLAVDLAHRSGKEPDIIIAVQSHLPSFHKYDPPSQRVAVQNRIRLAKLGLAHAESLPENSPTFSAACSSFVFALDWLREQNPQGKNVLIVVDETGYRKTLLPPEHDKQYSGLLMSDYAIALQFTYGEDLEVVASETHYDRKNGNLLYMCVPQIHPNDPFVHAFLPPYGDHFLMQGPDLRLYFDREITKKHCVETFLSRAGVSQKDLSAFLCHQASIRMVRDFHKLLPDIPYKPEGIRTYGNTSSASTVLDLEDGIANGAIQKGDNIYLLAFGGGLTWGQAVLRMAA
jgi:3-oxoacyl-[acyl-carrier-protein] synthase-3